MSKPLKIWLICGGRDYSDKAFFDKTLRGLIDLRGAPDLIVHGGATGADSLADAFARENGIDAHAEKADWRAGRAAGPIRNRRMLQSFNVSLVVAFPGGRGTANMVDQARKADREVLEVKP